MHEEDLIEEKKETDDSIGAKVGTAFGVLLSACLASIAIVMTAKLIYWIWLL